MSGKYKISMIVSLAVLACSTYFATFGIRTTDTKSLRECVEKDIRIGESPRQVIDYLRAQNFDPSDLIRPQVMHIGGHDYAGQSIVVAVKRNSARALLWKEMVYLVFVFDGDHKLARYDVFPVYQSF
jgi:hypothetical protein